VDGGDETQASAGHAVQISTEINLVAWENIPEKMRKVISPRLNHTYWVALLRAAQTFHDKKGLTLSSDAFTSYLKTSVILPLPPYLQKFVEKAGIGGRLGATILSPGMPFFPDLPARRFDPQLPSESTYRNQIITLLRGQPLAVLENISESEVLNRGKTLVGYLQRALGTDDTLNHLTWEPFELFLFQIEVGPRYYFVFSMAPLVTFELEGLRLLGLDVSNRTTGRESYNVRLVGTARYPEGGLTAWLEKGPSGFPTVVGDRTACGKRELQLSDVAYAITRRHQAFDYHPEWIEANEIHLYSMTARQAYDVRFPLAPIGESEQSNIKHLRLIKGLRDGRVIRTQGELESTLGQDTTVFAQQAYPNLIDFIVRGNSPSKLPDRIELIKTALELRRLSETFEPRVPPELYAELNTLRALLKAPPYVSALVSLNPYAETNQVSPTARLIETFVPALAPPSNEYASGDL